MEAKLVNALASADTVRYYIDSKGKFHITAKWDRDVCSVHLLPGAANKFATEDEFVEYIKNRMLNLRQKQMNRIRARAKNGT